MAFLRDISRGVSRDDSRDFLLVSDGLSRVTGVSRGFHVIIQVYHVICQVRCGVLCSVYAGFCLCDLGLSSGNILINSFLHVISKLLVGMFTILRCVRFVGDLVT